MADGSGDKIHAVICEIDGDEEDGLGFGRKEP